MKRRNFLATGICSCASACFIPQSILVAEQYKQQDEVRPKTVEERYVFAQKYIKRLMDVLGTELEEEVQIRIVRAMGAKCARDAYGVSEENTDRIPLDRFVENIGGRKEDDLFFWEYTGSPWTGLKVADGYCLCPLTEKGPEGLSGLWCECSVGYVQYMFERFSGNAVNVDLLESLKRGGNRCRFKISAV